MKRRFFAGGTLKAAVASSLAVLIAVSSAIQGFAQQEQEITVPASIPLYGPFEGQVQGATNEGGSQELVAGRLGRDVLHSVTGKVSDIVILFDNNNDLVDAYFLGDLAYNPLFVRTRPTVRLPDGQTRCFPRLLGTQEFARGYIGLYRLNSNGRGGVVLDLDPIRLRR